MRCIVMEEADLFEGRDIHAATREWHPLPNQEVRGCSWALAFGTGVDQDVCRDDGGEVEA